MNREQKLSLRKASVLLACVLIFATMLSGCAVLLPQALKLTKQYIEVETSEKYLVGFDYGSYRDVFGMAPVIICKVRFDKSVDATFEWVNQDGERSSYTLNFALTDDQFSNIVQNVDPQEIYYLKPQCADPDDVMDGGSSWLFVYGPDDTEIRKCGGFCPMSARYHEIRRTLFDNIPEKLDEVYSRYEEITFAKYEGENSELDEEIKTLFEDTYARYLVN